MDYDSSTKFISSLAKFLQSLCNGYVEFDNGVQVIGHLYLSVDTGKTIDYILNEKVCKTDENSVTFISNSFHAQPAERPKPPGKKTYEKDSKLEDTSENQTSNLEPRSTNFGTLPTRIAQNSPHSQNLKRAFSPSSKHIKDDGSPLKLGRSSPKHKKNRTESMDQNLSQTSNPASENSISSQPSPAADGIGASVSAQGTDVIHGSQYTDSYQQNFFQTGDEDNSVADESDERDIKPSIDTDVTFIKEEFAPSSCSQSGGQNRDRNHGEDSSAYYHSNQSFPASNFTSQAGFGGSVRSNFGSSADRSSLYTSGPASSQLEGENSGDPSVRCVQESSVHKIMKVKCCTKICTVCHETFKSILDYKTHIHSAHMTAQQYTDLDFNSNHLKFICAFCPESIVGYHEFCQHISNIGTPESECVSDIMLRHFQCAICHLDSDDIQLFRNHILHEHSTSRDVQQVDTDFTTFVKNRFACNHCDNTYSDMKGLKRHLAKVNGVTFWCEQCKKRFSRDDVFRKHLKTVHL